MVPKRRTLDVINKLSSESDPRSPYAGTDGRQSQQQHILAPRNKGEQLARAAAYIRERISRSSLTRDEESDRCPKVPPDKAAEPESDSRRLDVQVVNKETETSVTIRSPESEDSAFLLIQSDAGPQQSKTRRANELSSKHSDSIPWLPGPVLDEADNRRQ